MNHNSGNLTSYIKNGPFWNVIFSNDSTTQIQGTNHQTLPYTLPPLLLNVIHTPSFIKNLLSIHHFTIENNVSAEFHVLDFDVKYFRM